MASSPTTFAGHYVGTIKTWCAAFSYERAIDFYVDFDNKVTFVSNVTGTRVGGALGTAGAFAGGSSTIASTSQGNSVLPTACWKATRTRIQRRSSASR